MNTWCEITTPLFDFVNMNTSNVRNRISWSRYPNYESYNCTLQIRFKSRRSQSDHCSVIATDQSSWNFLIFLIQSCQKLLQFLQIYDNFDNGLHTKHQGHWNEKMFDAFLNFSNLFPSLAITKQIIQNRKISTLTLYTLTSVCKSSTLFSLHFLWHLEGQFVF